MEKIKILFANIYNSMPKQLQIAFMVTTSMLGAVIVDLIIVNLTALNASSSLFVKELIGTVIPFLTVVLNLLQQYAKQEGTKILATQGDTKTIQSIQASISEKQSLVK